MAQDPKQQDAPERPVLAWISTALLLACVFANGYLTHLWIKVHIMKEKGLFYEVMSSADLITKLQPRFAADMLRLADVLRLPNVLCLPNVLDVARGGHLPGLDRRSRNRAERSDRFLRSGRCRTV